MSVTSLRPTPAPALQEMEQLVEEGYFVRENLLPPDLLEGLRAAVDEVAAQERKAGASDGNGLFTGQFIRHLFGKHPAFVSLIDYAPTLSVARAVLGPAVQVRLSARISPPGRANQQTPWHVHVRSTPDPLPPFYSFPHTLDVLTYLDDLNEANGLLCVVPGTHRQTTTAPPHDDVADRPEQVCVSVRAGGGVFSHGHLWHRARPSGLDGTVRRLLALTYFPAWFKPFAEDGPPPADDLLDALRREGSREIRELLGETSGASAAM